MTPFVVLVIEPEAQHPALSNNVSPLTLVVQLLSYVGFASAGTLTLPQQLGTSAYVSPNIPAKTSNTDVVNFFMIFDPLVLYQTQNRQGNGGRGVQKITQKNDPGGLWTHGVLLYNRRLPDLLKSGHIQ